jgi:hypothetical protein
MKKISLMILCTMICMSAFSQTESGKHAGFQFTFFYPLGTNGMDSPEYENTVSFNTLFGVSRSENGLAFGGLANIILHDATGLQFAGLYNHTGNDGKGIQFAGLGNSTCANYKGLQIAGLINRVKENYEGLQFAGLVSFAGKSYEGVQLAGLMNCTKDSYKGIQFAALVNRAGKNYEGVQVTGIMNCTKGDYKGIQFAGLTNITKNVTGSQISGLVNVARKVTGLQISGLVNIADSSNCPVAIINLIKSGEKSIALTYSETGSTTVSFRSGGKITYGIVGCSYNHRIKGNSFIVESGLGAHINCSSRFRINNEFKIENSVFSKHNTFKTGYHLLADYKFPAHLSVFAGPSINYMYSNDITNDSMFPGHSLWKNFDASKLQQVFFGCQIGIQYIF